MGQFLPEVRGVFNLIERHKKDLDKSINESISKGVKNPSRKKSKRSDGITK